MVKVSDGVHRDTLRTVLMGDSSFILLLLYFPDALNQSKCSCPQIIY
jgi:hypothetical protein